MRTASLRAGRLLPGHSRPESAVRYPGIEIDDAPELAEPMDV